MLKAERPDVFMKTYVAESAVSCPLQRHAFEHVRAHTSCRSTKGANAVSSSSSGDSMQGVLGLISSLMQTVSGQSQPQQTSLDGPGAPRLTIFPQRTATMPVLGSLPPQAPGVTPEISTAAGCKGDPGEAAEKDEGMEGMEPLRGRPAERWEDRFGAGPRSGGKTAGCLFVFF